MPRIAVIAVLGFGLASLATPQSKKDDEARKAKKPALELRMSPRFSFSPVNILFTAELTGGEDSEEYHCPELEWDWDDGGRSGGESDCDPYEAGAKMERRFTANHLYKTAGIYTVKLTLRKANRTIAAQTVKVTVRPGVGDQTQY
ncbi:MAG TPA: PKD domain-containing protein [Vicinamibacteria bacterium]